MRKKYNKKKLYKVTYINARDGRQTHTFIAKSETALRQDFEEGGARKTADGQMIYIHRFTTILNFEEIPWA